MVIGFRIGAPIAESELGSFDIWNFSVFKFPTGNTFPKTHVILLESVLYSVALGIFKKHSLFSAFNIDESLFCGWLQDISMGYDISLAFLHSSFLYLGILKIPIIMYSMPLMFCKQLIHLF